MMSKYEAYAIVRRLILDRGRGFDWLCYKKYRHEISTDAKILALTVLRNEQIHAELKAAIEYELGSPVTWDWVERATALLLDDDINGDHITLSGLTMAKKYRMQVLGMSY